MHGIVNGGGTMMWGMGWGGLIVTARALVVLGLAALATIPVIQQKMTDPLRSVANRPLLTALAIRGALCARSLRADRARQSRPASRNARTFRHRFVGAVS
jgi:hypothetical protein